MITCKYFKDREFATKEELFSVLRENHDRLITQKKQAVKFTDPVSLSYHDYNSMKSIASKAGENFDWLEDGYVYPVINTTNYLDSHDDLHDKGLWNKSAKEQTGKTLWVANHKLEVGEEIAYEKDVEIIVREMSFKDLGYDSEMTTEALIFKVKKDTILNERIIDRINKGIATQHSIRMKYVTLLFAMNSSEKGDEEFKAVFDSYIDKIANRKRAEERGYFWVVKEAAIAGEGSSVINGSNDITPMLIGKDNEPPKSTQKTEEGSRHDDTSKISIYTFN